MFYSMMFAALLAVSVENMFLSAGMGFSRVLRAARSPRGIGPASLFVTFFSFCSSVEGYFLFPLLPAEGEKAAALRPAVLACAAAVTYMAAAFVLKSFFPGFYEKNSRTMQLSAINTAVLAIPYVQNSKGFGLAQSAGFALGSGLAFFIASALAAGGAPSCDNPDMPKAFRGLPASLIYVGILSMGFAGFTGGLAF